MTARDLMQAYTGSLSYHERDRLPRFLSTVCDTLQVLGCALVEGTGDGARLVPLPPGYPRLALTPTEQNELWRQVGKAKRPRPGNVIAIPASTRDFVTGSDIRAGLLLGDAAVQGEKQWLARQESETLAALVGSLLTGWDRMRAAASYSRIASAANARILTRDLLYRVAREIRTLSGFDGHNAVLAWNPDEGRLRGLTHLASRLDRRVSARLVGSELAVSGALEEAFEGSVGLLYRPTHRQGIWRVDTATGGLVGNAPSNPEPAQQLCVALAEMLDQPAETLFVCALRAQGSIVGASLLARNHGTITASQGETAVRFAALVAGALERDRQFEAELAYLEAAGSLVAPRNRPDAGRSSSEALLALLAQRIRRHRAADAALIVPYDGEALDPASGYADPVEYLDAVALGKSFADSPSELQTSAECEWHVTDSGSDRFPFEAETSLESAYSVALRENPSDPLPVGILTVGYARARAVGSTSAPIEPGVSPRDKERVRLYARAASQYVAAVSRSRRRQAIDAQVRDLYQRLSEREIALAPTDAPEHTDSYPLLEEILEIAFDLVHGTAGIIAVPCDEHYDLKVLVEKNLSDDRRSHIPYGEGVTGAAAQQRQPVIIHDARDPSTWPEGVHRLPWVPGSKSEVAIPLLAGGDRRRLLGVLDIESQITSDAFGDSEVEVLNQLAEAAAVALELRRVIAHLRALRDVAEKVDQAQTREAMLTSVLRQAMRVTGAYAGSVRVVDVSETALEPAIHLGEAGELATTPLPLDGDGVSPWVFRQRETCYIEDIADSAAITASYPGLRPLASRGETRSELAIPLEWLGDRTGVLNLEHVQPDGLRPSRDFVEGLAKQAASALYRERRQSRVIRSRDQDVLSGVVQMAYTIAHDIRLHFRNIKDKAVSMRTEAQTGTAIGEIADAIVQVADTGRRHTDELLNHAADPLATEELVNVADLVNEVVADASQAFPAATIDIAVAGSLARHAVVWCRRAFLGWSIKMVVENSCNYAGEYPNVRIGVDVEGASVRLIIEDDGPGMGAEEAMQLFEWERPAIRPRGSGYALPMVGSFVGAVGGTVRATPKSPMPGLLVAFYLPTESL